MNTISQFLLIIFLSFAIGLYLRKKIDQYREKKLIKELEEYFGRPLPKYKRSKVRIQWSRVLKMLRKEPTTQKVAHWKEAVKKLVKTEEEA